MNLQAAGGSTRIMKIVENIENFLIVPMLYKLYKMDQMHNRGRSQLPAVVSGTGRKSLLHPLPGNLPPHALPDARRQQNGNEGQTRTTGPFLAQYLMAGPLLAQLGKTGKTVDFDEFVNMVQDATNTSKIYKLIRPMSQESTGRAATAARSPDAGAAEATGYSDAASIGADEGAD